MSFLLDAGPSLDFLAVSQQNILMQAAAFGGHQLAVPERVDREIRGKAHDARFARTPVESTWAKLIADGHVQILDDTLDRIEFMSAISRASGMPAKERVRESKSLGEIMVIAHASVLAQSGEHVVVLIDDRDGRARAKKERDWLERRQAPGRLELWSTPNVLHEAERHPGWIAGDFDWTVVYNKMLQFDDALRPIF